MAKINAHGNRRLGPTYFTSRVRGPVAGDDARIYEEAYRLRSDGMVQTRIIRTRPVDGEGHTTEHSSAFRNLGKLKGEPDPARLRSWLESKGFEITKESWR